jgi:hypothetical protein
MLLTLKKSDFIAFLFLFFSASTVFASPKAEILLSEYESLKSLTKTLKSDGEIGGLFYVKNFSDHQLLWDKNDYTVDGHDTLRIFIENSSRQKIVTVTYYYSDYLIEGKTVLRRFLGDENKGWRADTADIKTMDDLETQGVKYPRLSSNELKIIKSYGITVFVD